ncbi:effector-associated constant component EACC1 [Streptomyces purpureus]|uniref:Uncharacterized protein n=1 Tax=Streptomyces purpureus TaxID=1951 RepID=A0A918GZI2_9ACTN|nr:hypothetical protein [Streptomyces purpureus]GGT26658.1 hypothetical protein GCM10014713_19800 [Streptomyces purpureus]
MRTLIAVHGEGADGAHELRRWLSAVPQLRGRIHSGATQAEPPAGAMGLATDALLAVLAPGGVAAVFAGAVVAWAQTRRGSQTITITRPDGTQVTVSTTHVRGLDAQQSADLARQLATDITGPPAAPGQTVPPDAPPVTRPAPPAPPPALPGASADTSPSPDAPPVTRPAPPAALPGASPDTSPPPALPGPGTPADAPPPTP